MTPEQYRIAQLDNEVSMGQLENVQRLLESGPMSTAETSVKRRR